MKHFIALSLLLSISGSIGAEIGYFPRPLTGSISVILREKKKVDNKRPRVPSRQMIECAYDGDCLAFTFAIPEGECEVSLTDNVTLSVQTHFIDSDCCHAEIYVGELSETTVTLVTESGATYSGTLTSE